MTRDHSQPLTEVSFILEPEKAGQQLDSLLHQKLPYRSRSYFQKIIRKGDVTVNGKNARPSQNMIAGDKVVIQVEVNKNWVDPESVQLDIIYEDDDLVVVNKAPWQIVHPTGQTQAGTVLNAVHARHNKLGGDSKDLPKVLHRIDQETSGVLVFAKGQHAGYYGQLFEKRQTSKTYLALLEGEFTEPFVCQELIGNNTDHEVKLAQWVVANGKKSISKFTPLICTKGLTFSKIKIETGRLHQIRVHSAYAGYPVLGDSLYNPRDEDTIRWTEGKAPRIRPGRPKRQLLHAYTLEFSSVRGNKLSLKAPLPDDFKEWGGDELVNFWNRYEK